MKRHWVEFVPQRPRRPMSFWVHRPVGDEFWEEAETVEPPWQPVVPGKGFPVFHVEVDGFTFEFASLAELDVCVETLSQRNLPTTLALSREHGSGAGPNSHWLARLPANAKTWRYREKAVRYLSRVRPDLEREVKPAVHGAARDANADRPGPPA